MEQIRIDGTAEGFFEFVTLRIMGKQFNLWWHSNYDDYKIIADNSGLEKVLKTTSGTAGMTQRPPDFEQKARLLNFYSSVSFEGSMANVRVVTFTKWGGFIQRSYAISRDFPHKVIKEESKTLLEYRINLTL